MCVLSFFANAILNPSAGALLDWNLTLGMLAIVFVISIFMTFVQKYATDQKTLKEMKEEQKRFQKEVKKLEPGSKEHTELSLESAKMVIPMMKIGMRLRVLYIKNMSLDNCVTNMLTKMDIKMDYLKVGMPMEN